MRITDSVAGGVVAPVATSAHLVRFYDTEDVLGEAVTRFIAEGLAVGESVIVIATEPHRRAFHQRLQSRSAAGLPPGATDRLLFLDAEVMLERFMRNGLPDPARFQAEVGTLLEQRLTMSNGRARAYGEMVDVLWKRGNRKGALNLEELWNDLQARHSFSLLCAYAMGSFYKEPAALHSVCSVHTHVLGEGSATPSEVRSLSREIAQREEIEAALRESIKELRDKEAELRRAERRLQAMTDALPVLVSHVDSERRYTFLSAAYERWFGQRTTDMVGRHLEEVLGPAAYEAIRPHVDRALAGEAVTFEAEIPYRDGGTRFIEASYVPQFGDDGQTSGFVALVADVSERKTFDRFRAAAASRLERLATITSAIADAVTTMEVFTAVVDQVAAAVGASGAALWLLDDDGETARLVRSIGEQDAESEGVVQLPLDASRSTPVLDAIRSGEPVWIASPEALVRDYPRLRPPDPKRRRFHVSCLPLVSRGRTLGTLALTIDRPREAGDEERGFLMMVARYAGQALERLRLLEAERRSRDAADAAAARITQLYQFAKSVMSAERVEDVFEAALDAIGRALRSDRGAILIYDDDKVMRFRAWRGLSEDYRRVTEGHSPWPPDAAAPEPIVVPDVRQDAGLGAFSSLFETEGIRSLAFIPLVTRGRLIGKFMVYFDALHTYEDAELELATSIANHLASVTARFAAIAELERTIRYNELFAGVLAHDLRNPIAAMMSAAQLVLMREEGHGDSRTKPLSRILSSGHRVTRMIDQLLDVTRARAGGGIPVEPLEADLADLCAQAIGELELRFPDWKIEREIVGKQDGRWDPDRILQAVSNLVSNAGQHGEAETPIRVRLDGRDPGQVTLEIHNRGAIPEALMPSLFDPFRGARARRDASRGLGLGLYIVKEIVRAHGGTVDVRSTPADGTTFTVQLPR
jgi:PAS domain S-box-containing protein